MNVMENANKITFGAVVLLLLTAVILSAISVSVGCSIKNSVKLGSNKDTADIPVNANVDENTATEPTKEKKVICRIVSENGFVAVKNTNGKIIRKSDIRTAFLPQSDREELEKGIDIYDESELNLLLADYGR